MSGKKRSEVLDLLSSASQIRDESLGNITRDIFKLIQKSSESQKKLQQLKETIELAAIKISKKDAERYAEEIDALSKKVNKLKLWAESDCGISPSQLQKEFNSIMEIFKSIDREADILRNAVRNKSHYCDSEYASASRLVQQTRETRNRLFQLQERAQVESRENAQKLDEGQKNIELNKRIQAQYNDIEVRVEADDNLVLINKEFGKIDSKLAHKFAETEYVELTGKIENAKSMVASELNKVATSLLQNITEVQTVVLDRKKEYDLKKEKAEREFAELMSSLSALSFKDLQASIFENKEITLGLFDFEKKYCTERSKDKFDKLKATIEGEIKKEKFDEASKHAQEGLKLLNESVRKATSQYEKMLKEKDIVCKLIEAVQKLSYDVNVEIIDDDIKNGYTLEAIAGDEVINFDKIAVDDEGNTIIDMDHQESVKGTCGNTAKNVMKSMLDQGIFITDIKKGSNSAVYGGKTAQAQGTVQREKKRM